MSLLADGTLKNFRIFEEVCIVWKSCRLGLAKRRPQEYNKLYRSGELTKTMLTDKSIRYIIRQLENGRSTMVVAKEMKVSQRHIQRLWAEYLKTGTVHIQGRAGRPKGAKPSDAEVKMVLDTHRRWPDGVQLTVKRLRKTGYNIGYTRVYHILKSNGMVTSSPAKSRQRKWVRYERLYSNAMWHTDWHVMKDPRMKGMNLITYLDDASRCVTGATLFKEATSENAVTALRQAIGRFGVPATILSDNGSCFVGARGRKKPKSSWMPTLFENELLSLNISLINSRPYHPQTNGKLERFHRSIEDEIWRYGCLDDYIEYYNTDRLHWALDIDNYETPMMAFHNKTAINETRRQNPKWMEADINE